MQQKLRISHKSFEKLANRFKIKFFIPAIDRPDIIGTKIQYDKAQIINLVDKIVKSYKCKSYRRYSAYTHKINRSIDSGLTSRDEYKVSYTFERVEGKLKLYFKLHLRKQKWVRPHRITEMVIRINEDE
jgi:hypothetical protein